MEMGDLCSTKVKVISNMVLVLGQIENPHPKNLEVRKLTLQE